ncbi:MAG: hypothetical protein IKK82_07945, partial [Kiritimatiellae bacterium]|nr:hypothetical protein [Kiritimatiellia bacterium]
LVQVQSLRPGKRESYDSRFSFVFPQKLPKSRIFAVNIVGLFRPKLGLEQARFLRLTICQTIVGDHMSEFGGEAGRIGRLFFDDAVQSLRCGCLEFFREL